MVCYLIVTHASFLFLDIKKKHSNTEKSEFTYQRLICKEFQFLKLTGGRYKVSTILIINSFTKIDKDFKTGF